MGRKRHTEEQIIRELQEAEVELAKNQTTGDVVRELGITADAGARNPLTAWQLPRVDSAWLWRSYPGAVAYPPVTRPTHHPRANRWPLL